jgi:hypothetical protein
MRWPERFRDGTIVVLLGLCFPHSAGAQNWQWAISERLTRERMAGLLNLPEIVGTDCAPLHSGRVALYAGPSAEKLPIGSIERARNGECQILARVGKQPEEQLPTDESTYDLPAAIVFQRAGPWFRIALQTRFGLGETGRGSRFSPLSPITEESLGLCEGRMGRKTLGNTRSHGHRSSAVEVAVLRRPERSDDVPRFPSRGP